MHRDLHVLLAKLKTMPTTLQVVSLWDTLPDDLAERIHGEAIVHQERARRAHELDELVLRRQQQEDDRRERESDEVHARPHDPARRALANAEYEKSSFKALEDERNRRLHERAEHDKRLDEEVSSDDEDHDVWVDDHAADTFVYRDRSQKQRRHKTFEAHPKYKTNNNSFQPEQYLTGAQHARAAHRDRTRTLHSK